MKILFDTNIVLDVLLDRRPYVVAASRLMMHVERSNIDGLLAATTVTTIHYLATKEIGVKQAKKEVSTLLSIFEVASVGRKVLMDALSLNFHDFENAVLHEAGCHVGPSGIVTRDKAGFTRATLPIYSGDTLLRMLEA